MKNDTLAFSVCKLAAFTDDSGYVVDNLLFPDGDFETTQGDMTLDAESAAEVLAAFAARAGDIVIDFEHQSIGGKYQKADGQAPAAGWITALRYEKGVGMIASVKWNEAARKMIKSDEYRYWSPAVAMRDDGKRPTALHSVGLTNTPAILDMPALAASDSAADKDGASMDKTLTLKPDAGLLAVLAEADDLEQFPAISEDQAALTRLVDAAKAAGADVADDASIKDIVDAVIPLIGESEGGGEPEGEGETVAASDIREALELDEGADVIKGMKELKAASADVNVLTLKASQVDDMAAQLKVLKAAEDVRTADRHEQLIKDAVAANKINPHNDAAMKSARRVLSTQGEEEFVALMGGLESYATPGATGAPPAEAGKRGKLIAASAEEWVDDRSRGDAKCSTYVNVALDDEGLKALTADEAVTLNGKDGA